VRTLASWGLAAYAAVFLALFGWPFLAPVAQGSLILPAEVVGQPLLQQVRPWLPWLSVGGVDFLPLALAVVLLMLRARLRAPLLHLEERWRARAGSPPPPLG